ncbi:hypothetical protein PsYK624_074220 [Phanerochaete sordida]|uniref:Carrier domain-containing protein n=1 Tax=Phanerochaete sordida TaxID=48140 RepID=A0A9P3LE96_9APHY|nr:hypothetical protein PsYK624_074220 [Phanerochaete sordida]
MHTSGSTGMPKPIYHPHRIWTEAIPCMPGKPAFTTTPLFHGGSADLLRSMNALSTLYLFSSVYPMTVSNITGALSVCPDAHAFLSVPYILKMLAENSSGLQMLQTMDLVSTGGAPLPELLGDRMVNQGVNLVSRLGSSECGFLMSSHRDYDHDKEWIWLRNDGLGLELLHFEPVSDSADEDLSELVVDKQWSTRVVSNRPDGSFASGDLYAKHPTKPNTWRYHGRTDDIIVLMTGKKASANPLETALRACPAISEAIVFGAERPALGVLIVPASPAVTRTEILERVRIVNNTSASYACIPEQLVVILTAEDARKIPKTSKGSVVRPTALHVFAALIKEAYRRLESGDVTAEEIVYGAFDEGEAMKDYIRSAVARARRQNPHAGDHQRTGPTDDVDLFNAGLDSVQAILVRSDLQKLVANCGVSLASNVVFEHPSITRLASHILEIRAGNVSTPSHESNEQFQHQVMRKLLKLYTFADDIDLGLNESSFRQPSSNADEGDAIVITGVTGSLGVHLMMHYLTTTDLHIFALVRASDDAHALRRIFGSIEHRKDRSTFEELQHRVTALAAELTKESLGIQDADYRKMAETAVTIIHVAWPVNFALSLESFEPALKGLRHLLDLACHTHRSARLIFCSSTSAAAHSGDANNIVYERLPEHERAAAPLGYARSKWVAEHLCESAHATALRGRVAVARLGQLCGATDDGRWNESEAWPLLLASAKRTSCLPMLGNEELSLLPYNIAARMLKHIADLAFTELDAGESSEMPIIHVLNDELLPWSELLTFLRGAGHRFEDVSPTEWMERLRALQAEGGLDAATANLLDLWQKKYIDAPSGPAEPKYSVTVAQQLIKRANDSIEVDWPTLVDKWVRNWRHTGFFPTSGVDA